ncbi:hypothetical protein [Bacillus sp. 1P02SD]
MQRSKRINAKIVKYSIILKALGILDKDDYRQIMGSLSNEFQESDD